MYQGCLKLFRSSSSQRTSKRYSRRSSPFSTECNFERLARLQYNVGMHNLRPIHLILHLLKFLQQPHERVPHLRKRKVLPNANAGPTIERDVFVQLANVCIAWGLGTMSKPVQTASIRRALAAGLTACTLGIRTSPGFRRPVFPTLGDKFIDSWETRLRRRIQIRTTLHHERRVANWSSFEDSNGLESIGPASDGESGIL